MTRNWSRNWSPCTGGTGPDLGGKRGLALGLSGQEGRNWLKITQPVVLSGQPLAEGTAGGLVQIYASGPSAFEPATPVDRAGEIVRLDAAMREMDQRMERIVEAGLGAAPRGGGAVLEAYRLITRSKEWRARLEEAVAADATAESAVTTVQRETSARFERIGNANLREWLGDLDRLANDLLRAALEAGRRAPPPYGRDTVVVAHDLGAGEMLHLEPRVGAIALETAPRSPSGAMVAASLRIPVVVGVGGLSVARSGDRIFVDGDQGTVLLRCQIPLRIDGEDEGAVAVSRGPRPGTRISRLGGRPQPGDEALGPKPRRSLQAMVDYGLSDAEIGRYYGLDATRIAELRRRYGIETEAGPLPEGETAAPGPKTTTAHCPARGEGRS